MVARQTRAMNPHGTFGRCQWHALSVLLGWMILTAFAVADAQAADKKTVVVLEIQGGTKQLQQAIINGLKDKYNLLPLLKWTAAAKKLNINGQAPQDYALIAAEVKADVVITGRIKQDKDGKWQAHIAARNGQSGNPLGKMSYDLKSAKVDADLITQTERDIGPAVEKALIGEPPPPVGLVSDEPPPAPLRGVAGTTEEEDPIAKMRRQLEEEQRRIAQANARPVWYPFFDIGAGFILSGRNFSFNEEAPPSNVSCYDFVTKRPDLTDGTLNPPLVFNYTKRTANACKNFPTLVAGGVHVDLSVFPLAFLRVSPVRGLGFGASFDYVFWPPSNTSLSNPENLDTREFRFEVGLRYHYNIKNKRSRPSILANLQYGGHYFSIAKKEKTITYQDDKFVQQTTVGLDDHGLPDIYYQYVTIGLGGRIPYYASEKVYFGLLLNFNFHAMLGYGEIANAFGKNDKSQPDAGQSCATQPNTLYCSSGYGPVNSGFGLRGSLTLLEAMVWRGLTIRLQGYYELFKYGFLFGSGGSPSTTLPPGDRNTSFGARHIAQAATDNYFGGIVQIGYQY